MTRSPHRRWKGHDIMCNMHTMRGNGKAIRTPWAALRKLGKRRRLTNRVDDD